MRRAIRKSVETFAAAFRPRGPILELGSRYQPGYGDLCDLRVLFNGQEYLGCDLQEGPGVDRIEDAQRLSFQDGSFGIVMMLETLEHMPDPVQAVREAHRVLRGDGLLVVSVPFTYRLHGFPNDFWRFTMSGVDVLLRQFPERIVYGLGPRLKPAFIFGVGVKTSSPDLDQKKAQFRDHVRKAFANTRGRGWTSLFKERSRDFIGLLLGRAEMGVHFLDEWPR